MRILLVDWEYDPEADHEIRQVRPAPGLVPVETLLGGRVGQASGPTFVPDVIIQRERLGPRVFLQGLEAFDCPKLFWAVDSHLNMFWQRWYGRLFDVVLTPHVSLFEALPPEWRLPDVRRLPEPGHLRRWRGYEDRRYTASFVGVRDAQRPLRNWLADMLRDRHGVEAVRLPFARMLELYDDTRLIPNEAICGEVNFRLMEGASCGCCVLTQDSGDDLAAVFEPGSEVLVYRHALELDELLRFFGKRPDLSERIGRAAQRRVQAEHLPVHRFERMLEVACTAGRTAERGDAARRALTLARLAWARSRPESRPSLPDFLPQLDALSPHPDVTVARLRLLVESGGFAPAREMFDHIVRRPHEAPYPCPEGMLEANVIGATAALRLGDINMFRLFWLRQHRSEPEMRAIVVRSFMEGCLLWADLLERAGRLCLPGFLFDPASQCPETAWDMLCLAEPLTQDREHLDGWIRKSAAIADRTPLIVNQLGCRARCSLNAPDDWRARLDYAHACLKAFRLDEGLEELTLACAQARESGQERHLQRLLGYLALRAPGVTGANA